MTLSIQVAYLFLLAIPVACVAWTVTHEEVFKEPRDYCANRCKKANNIAERKFFYLFTCEYCFSHYIAIFFLFITKFQLIFMDWRGYMIAGFSLVWIANLYMSLFGRLRIDLKSEKLDTQIKEEVLLKEEQANNNGRTGRTISKVD